MSVRKVLSHRANIRRFGKRLAMMFMHQQSSGCVREMREKCHRRFLGLGSSSCEIGETGI